MDSQIDKAELIRRMAQHYNDLASLLAKVDDATLIQPGAVGSWSLKDMVAHLIAHEQRALRELEAAKRGEQIVEGGLSTDEFNARFVAESASRSGKVMLMAWGASFRQLLNSVGTLDESAFAPDSAVIQALGDSIDGAVANISYLHYAEHLPEVRAWLAKVSPAADAPQKAE
ncbi:MAG TPA: maleylpyruvate isomerase N-terminal domain-containing protein [Aggregatilineales bacterium]|nr:maleylpyruvate isomerase N-terminal domain-containing protein [Aggregatilineales bacterium]